MQIIGEILNKPIYGIVYCTTNIKNGMKYIGKRKLMPNQRFETYLGSGIRLNNAISKYGRDSFIKETLCECYSLEDMNEMEQYYISYYNAVKSNMFYNIANGGDGGDMSHVKVYKKVCQYDLNGNLVSIYNCSKDIERTLDGYSYKSILRCCWGDKNKYKEYIFKFFDETNGNSIPAYIATQGFYLKKKVSQYALTGEFIKEYESTTDAGKQLGINNIHAAIVGKQKSAGGFVWKYSQPQKIHKP